MSQLFDGVSESSHKLCNFSTSGSQKSRSVSLHSVTLINANGVMTIPVVVACVFFNAKRSLNGKRYS